MAEHNDLGRLGEEIAVKFLKGKGLEIIQRNFWKPYGEIDIVSRENNITRFIEVKSVSYETNDHFLYQNIRPEENMHPQKIKKLKRVLEAYIISHETVGEWAVDLMCVYINQKTRSARVKWLKDIILE